MKARVITALVLAPIVLLALFLCTGWPLILLGAVVVYLSLSEFEGLVFGHVAVRLVALLAFGLGVLACYLFRADPARIQITTAVLFGAFALGVLGVIRCTTSSSGKLMWALLGQFWITAPIVGLIAMHGIGNTDQLWTAKPSVLMPLLPVWAGDTAAIFVGMAFGKHPLAPKISPKKTIEGGIGNLLAAGLAGWAFSAVAGVSPLIGTCCGVIAGTFGQAGDLFESYLKRQSGLKDSGSILPGHGGLLDRIDSLLFTAPILALVLASFR